MSPRLPWGPLRHLRVLTTSDPPTMLLAMADEAASSRSSFSPILPAGLALCGLTSDPSRPFRSATWRVFLPGTLGAALSAGDQVTLSSLLRPSVLCRSTPSVLQPPHAGPKARWSTSTPSGPRPGPPSLHCASPHRGFLPELPPPCSPGAALKDQIHRRIPHRLCHCDLSHGAPDAGVLRALHPGGSICDPGAGEAAACGDPSPVG